MGQLTMAFENDYTNRRTIDWESGAYLVSNGIVAAHRGLHRFSFHWKGEKIDFEAQEKEVFDDKKNKSIHWTFFRVGIPEHMQDHRAEISGMIRQALEIHGLHYDRKAYKEVTAEFVPP